MIAPRGVRSLASLAAIAALAAGVACTELEELDRDVCGNQVLEPGEDCDGFSFPGEPATVCVAPGRNDSCRYSCADDIQCPLGWGCGADRICRRATGGLDEEGRIDLGVPAGDWIGIGDVDGDHLRDVVTVDGVGASAHFLGLGASLEASYTLPLDPFGSPSLYDLDPPLLDDRGSVDVIVPTFEGMAVLRGTPRRTLEPSTYSVVPVPAGFAENVGIDLAPASAGDQYLGDEIVVLIDMAAAGYLLWVNARTNAQFLGLSPVTATQVQSPALAVQLPEPTGEPGPLELVIAAKQGDRAFVIDGDWPNMLPGDPPTPTLLDLGAIRHVDLDGGQLVAGSLRAVQLNMPTGATGDSAIACAMPPFAPGDDHVDLVIPTVDGPYVAYGTATGQFHSDACQLADPMLVPDNRAARATWVDAACGVTLTLGHLDGDGLPDVVTQTGIWLTESGAVQCSMRTAAIHSFDGWAEAAVADFTGDGRADLLVAGGSAQVEFFGNTGGPQLSHAVIPTLGQARTFEVADYDGNGLADLAFVEADVAGLGGDAVTLVFGQPFAPPSAPITVGALPDVFALDAMNRAAPGTSAVDGMVDLTVGSHLADDAGRFAVLYGRTDGHLQAPYQVPFPEGAGDKTQYLTPVTALAGRYAWNSAAHGFAMVARRPYEQDEIYLVAIDAIAPTALEDVGHVPAQVQGFGSAEKLAGSLVMAAPTIDTNAAAEEQPFAQPVVLQNQDDGLRIWAPAWQSSSWGGADPVFLDAQMRVAYGVERDVVPCALDADGRESLVLVGSTPSLPSAVLALHPDAIVAARDGSALAADDIDAVSVAEGEIIVDVACIELDGTVGSELVFVTLVGGGQAAARIYAVDAIDADDHLGEPRLLVELDAAEVPALALGVSSTRPPVGGLAAGDVTGDGVADVTLLVRTSIVVLPGEAVLP